MVRRDTPVLQVEVRYRGGGDLLDDGILAFVCPITNGLFEAPVVADDGRTYSRQAISDCENPASRGDLLDDGFARRPS